MARWASIRGAPRGREKHWSDPSDWFCGECNSNRISASGTVFYDAKRQEWLDAGNDCDNWYCSDCDQGVSVEWRPISQWHLFPEGNYNGY